MILIADSGATKTDWQLLQSTSDVQQFKTKGYSPHYLTSEEILDSLKVDLLPNIPNLNQITEVFFYGTGCSSEELCEIVKKPLETVFLQANINIKHDLLAAARALCNNEAGFVCILGTGSNVCFYDGKNIVDYEPNLGFWLGDEGSGAHLGKTIVVDYLYQDMPEDLRRKFKKRFPEVSKSIVVKHAYGDGMPSRYFASFSKFVYDNIDHQYSYQTVYDSFAKFFDKYVCKLEDAEKYKIHFVGSVAYYYADFLRKVAKDKSLMIGNILETPIENLVIYHQENHF